MAETETGAVAPWRRFFGLSVVAPLAVAAAGTGIFLWRTLSWPSASSNDAWAYAAWGQAIGRGEQLVYNAGTTPKPLASVLAAIVSPFPPTRAWALVIALALGVLVAGLLAAGYREAGPIGAAVAPVAFVLAARLDEVIWFSLVDAVTAALVVLAIVWRGRARIAPLVLAGLLRPEAWLASALAGYVETTGSRLRKSLSAFVSGLLPLVLWFTFDLALAGDALATRKFQGTGALLSQGPLESFDLFRGKIILASGAAFALGGGLGLLVHGWRSYRRGEFPFPLALAFVWAAALFAQTVYGYELNARYFLPLVAILALGWGFLVAAVVPRPSGQRPIWIWAAAVAAIAATVLATVQMDFGRAARRVERDSLVVRRSLHAVEPVLDCGRLGLVGDRHVGSTIGRLSAATRTSLTRFERAEPGPANRYAGVLAVEGKERGSLPAWPLRRTPLGPLAVNPDCL